MGFDWNYPNGKIHRCGISKCGKRDNSFKLNSSELLSWDSGYTSDRAMYGRFKLNTSTNEVHVQGISIEEERKGGATANAYGCFKFFGTGKKGDMMVIAKTRNAHSGDSTPTYGFAQLGHFTGGTTGTAAQAKDISDMDAACLPDLTTTADQKGNIGTAPGSNPSDWEDAIVTALAVANGSFTTTTDIFDMSCKDLNEIATASAGGAFDSDNGVAWVNFNTDPSSVFPTAAADLTAPTKAQLCTNLDGQNTSGDTKCYCP